MDPWPRSVGEGSGIAVSCGVGHRHSSDLALLWLWCRPEATAPIRTLAWEFPYAVDAALKRQKNKNKKERERRGGVKDDSQVSGLNGWTKGWQVPLMDVGNSGEKNRFCMDGVVRKCSRTPTPLA